MLPDTELPPGTVPVLELVLLVAAGALIGVCLSRRAITVRVVHELEQQQLSLLAELHYDAMGAADRLAHVGEELAHRPGGTVLRALFGRPTRAPAS